MKSSYSWQVTIIQQGGKVRSRRGCGWNIYVHTIWNLRPKVGNLPTHCPWTSRASQRWARDFPRKYLANTWCLIGPHYTICLWACPSIHPDLAASMGSFWGFPKQSKTGKTVYIHAYPGTWAYNNTNNSGSSMYFEFWVQRGTILNKQYSWRLHLKYEQALEIFSSFIKTFWVPFEPLNQRMRIFKAVLLIQGLV